MNETLFEYDSRLDVDFLQSIYENDKEHAAMVFEQFLLSYPDQIKEINESYISGDVVALKQRVHKLKPTFSFVGLTTLTTKEELIEKECSQNAPLHTIEPLYTDFKNSLEEYIPIVETQFKNLTV